MSSGTEKRGPEKSRRHKPASDSDRDSKTALINAAKKVFAQKGYDGATVKDIADAAGVNVSLVSYHFDGKENLYRHCLTTLGSHTVATAQRVLKAPTNAEEFRLSLRLFAEEFIAINRSENDVCKILHRDFESPNQICLDVFKESFLPMFNTLVGFFSAAKSNGLLRKDVDPNVAAPLIFGGLVHLFRMEQVHLRIKGFSLLDPAHVDKTVQHFVQQAIQGTFAEKRS